MSFEWDENKRQENIRKHGLDFKALKYERKQYEKYLSD